MTITILRPGDVARRMGELHRAPQRKPPAALWAMLLRTFDELRRCPDQEAALRHWLAGELADMKAELLAGGTDMTPEEIVIASRVEPGNDRTDASTVDGTSL